MSDGQRRFVIGRDRSCDIPIADDSVSRAHAELIVTEDGRIFLADCRSRNGTALLVQGRERQLGQEYVAPDDEVRFGAVWMRVRDLLDAIRPQFPAPEGPRKNSSLRIAEKLIRCGCGAVIRKGGRCKICSA